MTKNEFVRVVAWFKPLPNHLKNVIEENITDLCMVCSSSATIAV